VHDDVSRHIAVELHPKLSHIERQLRTFLNRFFLNVVGPDWLRITASPEVYHKMNTRRVRDQENWKSLFDNELAYMDFHEIGALITKQSTGLSNPDDLPMRIQQTHTLNDLQALKHDLESNYSKYFRETFQERKFHKLWSKLNIIRNKVAHNAPLTSDENSFVDESIPKLERLLRDAELRIRSVQLTEKELETVKEQQSIADVDPGDYHDLKPSIKVLGKIDLSKVREHLPKRRTTVDSEPDSAATDDVYEEFDIEDWELLEALDEQIASGHKINRRFLALSTFIRLLEDEGFSRESVKESVRRLSAEGVIEVYLYEGEHSMKSTRAVRRVE